MSEVSAEPTAEGMRIPDKDTATQAADMEPTKVVAETSTLTQNSPPVAASTAKANTKSNGNGGITFASQGSLPRLPIPSLEETMTKLLEHLKPLQDDYDDDDEEWKRTQEIVKYFREVDGPKLQQLLLDYDRQGMEQGNVGSYVEAFWNDAYLAPDASVVLNLNPFFVLEDGPDPKIAKDPILRSASLCFAAIKMVSQLRKEEMAPDTIKGGRTLCMDQFRFLFGTARVPRKDSKDTIHVYDSSNHIAVLRRGQMYYFQVLWPDGDVAVDDEDLRDILAAIERHAADLSVKDVSESSLGVLTSLSRTEWARAREQMIHCHAINRDALQIVDSALFVLVLDDYIPETINQAAANMLHGSYKLETDEHNDDMQVGTCCNRWYDKLQIIVCEDGTAGINFEHSAIDGHTALRFVSDVYAETVISFAQSITKSVQAHSVGCSSVINANIRRAATILDANGRATLDVFPKRVPFVLPASVKKQVYFAETALGDQIVSCDTEILEFTGYGKLFIVGNKLSPDSVVQVAILLAYYKLYGKVVCAYEPVMTKAFYHGRTEAMRSATSEAKELCKLWSDETATSEDKIAALRKATQKHSTLVRECAKGKGVDRHLYALKCIAERENVSPKPKFFESEAWAQLNHTILSTSNCGNPALRLFGFGPVVSDGFGIGYIIKDHRIQFAISSKSRQTKRYINSLQSVFGEIAAALKPLSKVQIQSQWRPSLKQVGSIIAYDSYGDIWGESASPAAPAIIDAEHTISESIVSTFPIQRNGSLTANHGVHDPQNALSMEANASSVDGKKQRGRSNIFSGLVRQESLEYAELSKKSASLSLDEESARVATNVRGESTAQEKVFGY